MPAWMPCESCCPEIQPYIRSSQRPGHSPVFTEGKEAQRAPSDQEQKNWENLKISATKSCTGDIKEMKEKIGAEICPEIRLTKGSSSLLRLEGVIFMKSLMALAMAGSLMIPISAFAEMRYADDMPDNDMDAASEEICHKARAANTEVLEGYVHIPLTALGHDAPQTRSAVPRDVLLEIYGSHFIKAGVGDKVPQIYVKEDGSGCCVIDENQDAGVTKTFYEVDGGTFTKIA